MATTTRMHGIVPPLVTPLVDRDTLDAEGQAVAASDTEAEINPRARSAKLRSGVRTQAASGKADLGIFDLPQLASIERMGG